ncbi:uncharacterized protein [Dermacentor andersoni]|uniref:uncharacterized protein isoform X2 n=1 Tax=Dermacentor andersoni TaxID=34620 RepID=UPI003B3B8502
MIVSADAPLGTYDDSGQRQRAAQGGNSQKLPEPRHSIWTKWVRSLSTIGLLRWKALRKGWCHLLADEGTKLAAFCRLMCLASHSHVNHEEAYVPLNCLGMHDGEIHGGGVARSLLVACFKEVIARNGRRPADRMSRSLSGS